MINPELRGVTSDKTRNWNESEYLLTRINNYPDKKKFMDSFVKTSAQYQKDLEIGINVHKDHLLDTSIINQNKQPSKQLIKSKNIVDELDKLNKLYKSGGLTKQEYDQAKAMLLK